MGVLEAKMDETGCLTMSSKELNRRQIPGRGWSAADEPQAQATERSLGWVCPSRTAGTPLPPRGLYRVESSPETLNLRGERCPRTTASPTSGSGLSVVGRELLQ